MPSRIDWYLVELDRQLGDLPADRRLVLLTEVESHLREEMDAMVSAGATLEFADIEAVRVFGEPTQFAEKVRGRRTTLENEASLRGTGLVIAGGLIGHIMYGSGIFLLVDTSARNFLPAWAILCGVGIFAAGLASRRITLASIAVFYAATGLMVAVILTTLLATNGFPKFAHYTSPWHLITDSAVKSGMTPAALLFAAWFLRRIWLDARKSRRIVAN